CGFDEVRATGLVEHAARRADNESAAVLRLAVLHGERDVASLCADAGDEERHIANDLANLGELPWVRRADHEHAVATRVPLARRKLSDDVVEPLAADLQILNVPRAGIGRAAEDDDALVVVLQEGFE